MIDNIHVEELLNKWRERRDGFASKAKYFTDKQTGYYGKMAEAERGVAEHIISDLKTLLLKAK